jgi:hypothetical protein
MNSSNIFRFSSWAPAHFSNNVHRPVTRGGTKKKYNKNMMNHAYVSVFKPPQKNTNKSSASQIDISYISDRIVQNCLFCCVGHQLRLNDIILFLSLPVARFTSSGLFGLFFRQKKSAYRDGLYTRGILFAHPPSKKKKKQKKTCWTMTWREKKKEAWSVRRRCWATPSQHQVLCCSTI